FSPPCHWAVINSRWAKSHVVFRQLWRLNYVGYCYSYQRVSGQLLPEPSRRSSRRTNDGATFAGRQPSCVGPWPPGGGGGWRLGKTRWQEDSADDLAGALRVGLGAVGHA